MRKCRRPRRPRHGTTRRLGVQGSRSRRYSKRSEPVAHVDTTQHADAKHALRTPRSSSCARLDDASCVVARSCLKQPCAATSATRYGKGRRGCLCSAGQRAGRVPRTRCPRHKSAPSLALDGARMQPRRLRSAAQRDAPASVVGAPAEASPRRPKALVRMPSEQLLSTARLVRTESSKHLLQHIAMIASGASSLCVGVAAPRGSKQAGSRAAATEAVHGARRRAAQESTRSSLRSTSWWPCPVCCTWCARARDPSAVRPAPPRHCVCAPRGAGSRHRASGFSAALSRRPSRVPVGA